MLTQIQEFNEEIKRDYSSSDPKFTSFPSGAAMLDIKVGLETYVMEYHLETGIGVSKLSNATFGWEGYEHPFSTFVEAKLFVLSLLNQRTELK